jgi:hypothetical protein
MTIISTVANSPYWSCLAVILAVGVLVGGVILRIGGGQFFKLARGRIEQKRQVPGPKRPRLDLEHEKINCERWFAWFHAVAKCR